MSAKEFEEEDVQQMGQQEIEYMIKHQQDIERSIKDNGWNHFSRPPLKPFESIDDFHFMQIDCDQFIDQDTDVVIRMFGLTEDGNSILVNIEGFKPYFYIQKPQQLCLDTSKQIDDFVKAFNNALNGLKNLKRSNPIHQIEVVEKESLRFYKGEDMKVPFLKIVCHQPSAVSTIKNWLKVGREFCGIQLDTQSYESNMPYALRFMIDKDIVGMGWVSLSGGLYNIVESQKKVSRCQLEFTLNHKDIKALPTSDYPLIAPIRVLSFDIECAAKKGFPNARTDAVIQIACIVKEHNQPNELVRVVFTHLECDSIPGARVKSFKKEQDLLKEFELFFQALDPDFIIGYNIQNFDFPYLMDRAKALGIENYGKFPRVLSLTSAIRDVKFLSKAMGMRDTKELNIEGRIQLDMMMHMFRDHKLSSYTLNNVSFLFLKEQKEDVHHSIIYSLQYGKDEAKTGGNPESRKRIAVYCLKDACLPILLMEKLMCLYNYAEMARVTGVPINYLFMRGQQIKVASMLYREAKKLNFVIPADNLDKPGDKFVGAFVLEPQRKFYKNPIATLDFASLYPSIMMAHNLCYTTLIQNKQHLNLDPSQITTAPTTNSQFVKPTVRKGLLPIILENLIRARKQARFELSKATDPMIRAVLEGRQLALKVSANSVYGFTGAQVGQLPCLEISASVTGFGREMIMKTKEMVEKLYTKEKGYQNDAVVIYGDTDSVMVNFGVEDIKQAMKFGKEAADEISKCFESPIKLEFEKVYWPYLLINPKKYAGLYWTKTDKYDKVDTKGIESVRRDNCPLIRRMINVILELIFIEKDEKKAVEYTKAIISDLLQNKIDISDLVITKSLNKKGGETQESKQDNKANHTKVALANTYKVRQAHVILAEKMQQRDETTAPSAGDRIPYVMIDGGKGTKNFDNAEDPIEVLMKDLPIDFDYYITKQIKQPLMRIFHLIIPNAEAIFHGEHTQTRYLAKLSQNSALGKFIIKKKMCLNCKGNVTGNEPLCYDCTDKAMEIITIKTTELQKHQTLFHEYWVQCQRCQGSLHEDVICSNRDCPIFYGRKKVQRDLQEKWTEIDRFEGW